MRLAPSVRRGVSEIRVDGLEGKPPAGEVAGVEPLTEPDAGGEIGTDTAGALQAHRQ